MISPFRRLRPDRSSHVVNKIACKSSDFNVVFTTPYFCWPPPAPSTVQSIPFFPFFANLGGTKPLLKMYVSTACPPSSSCVSATCSTWATSSKKQKVIHQKHIRKLHWFISESFRWDHELNKFYNRFRKAHWKRKAIEYLQSQGRRKKSKEISKYRKGCKDR